MVTAQRLYDQLSNITQFGCGLPIDEHLHIAENEAIFRHILEKGYIQDSLDLDQRALSYCHRRGWILSNRVLIENALYTTRYVLASPLHESYLSFKLSPQLPNIRYGTVLELSMAILAKFSYTQFNTATSSAGWNATR